MKVALVSAHYAPAIGGVEKHLVEIATRLAARGEQVEVLTHAEPGGDLAPVELINAVRVRRFGVPVRSRNYALSPALWRHLGAASSSYDVVHAHGYHALPALQSALSKPPAFVFTPHYHGTGHSPVRKLLHPPYRILGRRIFALAERIIAVSPPEARLILSHFPAAEPRLVVIPNGVDLGALDRARPFAEQGTIILSAGRLESYKQVDRTIAALRHLGGEFVLRVTGDGSVRGELERGARESGVGERVTFLGKVSEHELYRWFRSAAVYVSLSRHEAMPVALIESLAAGARVLASDIPAHRDLVKKTRGSIRLVPLESSSEAIAGAIRELLASPLRKPKIDTWDEVTARTVTAYEEAIAAAPRMLNGDR